MRWTLCTGFILAILSNNIAFAEADKSNHLTKIPEIMIPVFEGDIARPYRVIGVVNDNLRKHFAFQTNPTKEKIYAEIWERGRKMGADAVINARFGTTKGSLFNHGSTPISGTAIKYIDATNAK